MSGRLMLMIAPSPPLPDNGGGIAMFGDLHELKQRGHVVDLICFQGGRPLEAISELESVCRHLFVVEGPLPWTPGVVLNALFRQQPMVVVRHKSAQMERAISKQLAAHPYGVVLVEFSFMFQYFFLQPGLVFAGEQPLLVVDHHVVTPKVYGYFSHTERNPLLKLFRRYEIPRLKRYLKLVLTKGDKHLFLGREDLDYVTAKIADPLDKEKLIYRPTGLMLNRYPLADPTHAEPGSVGFFGAFDWEANVDAVLYFVEDILPLIQAEMPQLKLLLAGRAAPPQIQNLAQHPFIEFVGEVKDMFQVAQRMSVIVVPLRIGAGTRLKILEAMAWGKPIVTTSVGVEGVEHSPGQDLMVADTPEAFARATIVLLKNSDLRRRLGEAGRQRIESNYTTQSSGDRLQVVLNSHLKTT